jgi:hypothetical protein
MIRAEMMPVLLKRRYATVIPAGGPWVETHGYNPFSLREMGGHRPPLQSGFPR